MNKHIRKFSTGKMVLFLFILTNLVYVIMLAVTIPRVADYAGGMKLLDMLPSGYGLEYVSELFGALGEEGRIAYLRMQLPIDMIYPLLFGLCYCFLLVWMLRKTGKEGSKLFYFCYLPLIAAVADYLENFGIIYMLKQFPDISSQSAGVTSIFSMVKSAATSLYFVLLIIALLFLLWKWLRKVAIKN